MEAVSTVMAAAAALTDSTTTSAAVPVTTASSIITKRYSAKLARIQGYVVRGVTAANKPPPSSADGQQASTSISGSLGFNTKRSALRLVRPTVAGRSAMMGRSSTGYSSQKTAQDTYYSGNSLINSSTTLGSDWTLVHSRPETDGRPASNRNSSWVGSITELINSTTTWRDPYLNISTAGCSFLNGTASAVGGRNCQGADDGLMWDNNNNNGTGINGTSIDDDMEAKNFWALLLFLFPLLTVFGNVLVILSVYRERALQTATNYFIISLAIADLLVATLVMPFAVYVTVNSKWDLPDVVCDFYIAMDVTCSTSSILNLVAISIDRYIAVTQPLKYARHKNHKRVWLTIGLVWAISVAIGLPIVLGLNNTERRIPTDCGFYNADFVIYSSLSSFYIPCIIMIFLYYQIFKGIRERAKRATANRKPQHAHLMDNLAPHTKRLAETAMGGPPIAGGQQQTVPQTQRVHVTTPAGSGISNATDNNAGGSAGGGAGAGATTALAGSLLSPPGVTLAKTTLLGRAASMTMGSKQQSRRRSLFDDEKGTDQGSGSQDEDDDDNGDEWAEDGSNSGLPRDISTEFMLAANKQKEAVNQHNAVGNNKAPGSLALASKTLLLTTTTTTVAAATAATMSGLSNGDASSNYNNQQPVALTCAGVDAGSLGHSLMTDGVSCLSLPTSQQHQPISNAQHNKIKQSGSNKGKGTRSGGGGSSCGVDSTAGTPPSGSGNNGNGGNGNGADKESKQYQTAGSRFTIYKVNKASRKKREKSSAKKERKATKTLAIVLGVFLICWVPFFTCNILDAICTKFERDCQPGGTAFQLTTWLGYVNSFINPVIYTIFNLEFRKAFKRILVCAD